MRFRHRQRLRRPADFAAVRKEGRRLFGAAFVFSWRRRPAPADASLDLPRFAVIAPRRVGPSVERNRLKRCLREIFRQNQALFPAEVDVIVVLQPRAAAADFAALERDFLAAARKAGFAGSPPNPALPAEAGGNAGAAPKS